MLSPINRAGRIIQKFRFHERYGVSEFYAYDPHDNEVTGWVRKGPSLEEVTWMNGWTSPLLGIRFQRSPDRLLIFMPDGCPFLSYAELRREIDELRRKTDAIDRRNDAMERRINDFHRENRRRRASEE